MTSDKNATSVEDRLAKWVPLLASGLAFMVGSTFRGFDFVTNMAPKPFVEKGLETVRNDSFKYTDTQVSNVTKELKDYTDNKALRVEQLITQQGSDIKSLSTKTDLMLDSLRAIQNQQSETRRR